MNSLEVTKLMQAMLDQRNWVLTREKNYVLHLSKTIKDLDELSCGLMLEDVISHMHSIRYEDVAKGYSFLDGSKITQSELKRRFSKHSSVAIIPKKRNRKAWLFFLPSELPNFPVKTATGEFVYANSKGDIHGKGDFIVADDNNGHPDLTNLRVLNGLCVPRMYDMRSVESYIKRVKAIGREGHKYGDYS